MSFQLLCHGDKPVHLALSTSRGRSWRELRLAMLVKRFDMAPTDSQNECILLSLEKHENIKYDTSFVEDIVGEEFLKLWIIYHLFFASEYKSQ